MYPLLCEDPNTQNALWGFQGVCLLFKLAVLQESKHGSLNTEPVSIGGWVGSSEVLSALEKKKTH